MKAPDTTLYDHMRGFYYFFCFVSRKTSMSRLQIIFPKDKILQDEYHHMVKIFTDFQMEFMSRGLSDTKKSGASGTEWSRKLTQIAYCMKLCFEMTVTQRLWEGNDDPLTIATLQNLNPKMMFKKWDL